MTTFNKFMRLANDTYYNGKRYYSRLKKEVWSSNMSQSQKMRVWARMKRETFGEYE